MMRLADVITRFESRLSDKYAAQLLPSHRQALAAIQSCRSRFAPHMLATCSGCHTVCCVPVSGATHPDPALVIPLVRPPVARLGCGGCFAIY